MIWVLLILKLGSNELITGRIKASQKDARAEKEKTTETQHISAARKGTPWVVFENVSIILRHTVIFGLLGAEKDLSLLCKNLEMIIFAWSHASGSAKPHSYTNYLHPRFEKRKRVGHVKSC